MFRHLAALLILFTTFPLAGLELYSLVDERCRLTQGVIVGADEKNVQMIDLKGQAKKIQQDNIKFVLIHNTLENPIDRIKLNEDLRISLNQIYIKGQRDPLFTGWAVRFIENLVLFYDIRGNSHALELYQISKIRPVEHKIYNKPTRYLPVRLHMGSVADQCGLKNSAKSIRPTRILGDKVQISEVLDNFKKGFAELESYKERTYLYAKPYLYEKKTRMGIAIEGDRKETLKVIEFPLYFQWANGSEYRFQSFNQVGNLDNEYLPTVERFFAFRSDLKSHIFHASFIGNLTSLAAGTEFFTPLKNTWGSELDAKRSQFSQTASSFNYMALMGGDWGPFSVSFGTFFANHLVYVKRPDTVVVDEFREILASNISPILRFMITTEKMKLMALASKTSSKSNNVNDLDVSIDEDNSTIGSIDSYSFDSLFFRVNGDYSLSKDLSVGASGIYKTMEYDEVANGNANFMKATHITSQVRVKHAFGEYVSIRLYGNYHLIERDFRFTSLSGNEDDNGFTFGGSFEFVF